jgi:hypothetical protein
VRLAKRKKVERERGREKVKQEPDIDHKWRSDGYSK